MSAIRLARGFTGRDLVVKFAGCYHGHVDSLLAEAGSGLATHRWRRAVPGHPRRAGGSTAATLVLPYNDREAVEAAFAERGAEIACLITEASPGNMGVVPPEPGFNQFLAETCARHGALFVSDEVMTGFRVSRQGQWGLDGAVEGWTPDLVTFGKVMGGGFPAAAFGGRADVMAMLSPDGPVYQAGTLSGNPVATTAGLATLRLATDEVYAHIDAAASDALDRGRRGADPGRRTPRGAGGRQHVQRLLRADGRPVRDFAEASAQDTAAYRAFFHAMLDQGVYLPPSAFEAWFLSAAHDDRAMQHVLDALPAAAAAAAERHGGERRSVKTIVHLLRHGEVHNPQGILYGRSTGYHLSERGVRWPTGSPTASATATSPTSCPRRSSAPRRRRRRSRPRAASRSSSTSG